MHEKSTIALRSKGLDAGYFYAIQLVPESAPKRVKLGWANDVKTRLSDHRVSAPTAILLRTWPCLKRDEAAAIRHVAPMGEVRLSKEAFDFADHPALLSALDDFFLVRAYWPTQPAEPRLPLKMEVVGGELGIRAGTRPGQGPRRTAGEFLEIEVTVPGGYAENEIRLWLTRHFWEPLVVYFAEASSRRDRRGQRRFRLKLEIVE